MLRSTRRSLSSFSQLGVDPILCERLSSKLGIIEPTEIQSKSLPYSLQSKHVVANAETGTGKTLCFLLPILQKFLHLSRNGQPVPPSHAMILVPTSDLAHQVNRFFSQLSCGHFNSTIAHRDSRLSLSPSTHLVIATPTTLHQYDLRKLLLNTHFLCYDEADSLFEGGHAQASWNILKTFKGLKKLPISEESRQILLTAATLPVKGPRSVGVLISKGLPRETVYVNTGYAHHMVPRATIDFEYISHEVSEAESLNEAKFDLLVSDLEGVAGSGVRKALVFCNSKLGAVHVCERLASSPGRQEKGVGLLHKGVPPLERASTVESFNAGETGVLVSTDLGSRGLDLVDVDLVVMYDFPVNVSDFIHRAGRTARAGKYGRVRAYVSLSDRDLADAIGRSLGDNGLDSDLSHLFSRNKLFRKYIKRKEKNVL